jgi:tocopherol O-methyltransferase
LEIKEQIRESKNEQAMDTISKEKIQRFYDLGSPYYLSVYGEHIHDGYYITGKESRKEAQDNLVRLLAGKARIKSSASILDVGCGVGGSSIWMANNLGATTLGITISPVQLEIARRIAAERGVSSQFLLMDAEKMSFNQSFEVIWVVAALSHFHNPASFLKRAANFLEKNGKFVIYDWMPDEEIVDPYNDPYLQPVSAGMLLASLMSFNSYWTWFTHNGYRVVYGEDITDQTVKTWDDAASVIKDPAVWKFIPNTSFKELKEFISFFKSIRKIKLALQKGKLRSCALVAEKMI